MLPSHASMPLRYRILDSLGSGAEGLGMPLTRMDAERLHQLAERETGLSDFGVPCFPRDSPIRGAIESVHQFASQRSTRSASLYPRAVRSVG